MIITYLRSSSLNTWNSCQQKYLFQYLLGEEEPTNKSAAKGSCMHKVMEILALCSQAERQKKDFISDEIIGRVKLKNFSLDDTILKCFHNFQKRYPELRWTDKDVYEKSKKINDLEDIRLWVRKSLNIQDGAYDPRNLHVLECEKHFDVELPWEYDFFFDGKELKGHFSLKGTIDLICTDETGIIELIDWKTGRKWDWATGEEKTYEKLQKDPQLLLYYYVATKLYPGRPIIFTIIYMNDGGPVTIAFDEKDRLYAEQMLKDKFEEIKNCSRPNVIWPNNFCRFCTFGKTYYDNPMLNKDGTPKSKCLQLKEEIYQIGLSATMEKYMQNKGTHVKYYGEGGGREAKWKK